MVEQTTINIENEMKQPQPTITIVRSFDSETEPCKNGTFETKQDEMNMKMKQTSIRTTAHQHTHTHTDREHHTHPGTLKHR